MEVSKKIIWFRVIVIFALGVVGILSMLPIIPKLLAASGQAPPFSMFIVQAISVLQSAVILMVMVMLGAWLSPKIGLGTPLLDAYLQRTWNQLNLGQILGSAAVGGILGGVLLVLFTQISTPHLPPEFLDNAKDFSPPLYTKLLYGGITEEILIRWGLMSFVVWGSFRLTQSKDSKVRAYHYILGIVVSAFIFGLGHLPVASLLSPVVTNELVAYIIVGNSIFGLIAGYLYWQRGLEAAILGHMLAHVVMVVGEAFF